MPSLFKLKKAPTITATELSVAELTTIGQCLETLVTSNGDVSIYCLDRLRRIYNQLHDRFSKRHGKLQTSNQWYVLDLANARLLGPYYSLVDAETAHPGLHVWKVAK